MTNQNPVRYINIACILQNGCTLTTQVWTNDRSEAQKVFDDLIFRQVRQKNPVILAAIVDEYAPIVRYTVLDLVASIVK